MSAERDELAQELFIADNANQPREQSIIDWQWLNDTEQFRYRVERYKDMAAGVIASGYRKPRTITTVAELDALPVGAVIRTSGVESECEPRVARKDGFWTNESEWLVADHTDWCISSDVLHDLPATVLHVPEVAE